MNTKALGKNHWSFLAPVRGKEGERKTIGLPDFGGFRSARKGAVSKKKRKMDGNERERKKAKREKKRK